MDLQGHFPQATELWKYLIMAIDYFTKWMEAKPLAKITVHKVEDYMWKNIICRYSLPFAIVTDNGIQFSDKNY